jgi:glutamate-ammonia-ligase adenylyltransferase
LAPLVDESTYTSVVARLSRFLSEELSRHPQWSEDIGDVERVFSVGDYRTRLARFLHPKESAAAIDLATFRRKELLRIVLRDGLGAASIAQITEEISNLADAILGCALQSVTRDLASRFGEPQMRDGSAAFTVLALGKLGGRELNYSSDIDLMFLFSEHGETSGPQRVSNREYFHRLANGITHLLSTYTPAGVCYRVDLRLRPEGTLGEVCLSLASAQSYYTARARDWELQMLIKARVAAGDEALGSALLGSLDGVIYSAALDFSTIEAMWHTRERIHEKLARKQLGGDRLDVKLTRGGIRDIEFLVQCLQRLHGARDRSLQHRGTLSALASLYRKDVLSTSEYTRLDEAYQFLRTVEHRLQLVDDRQTHALPAGEEEMRGLAARMPGAPSVEHLLRTLHQHLESVQLIYDRIIHAQRPLYYQSFISQGERMPDAEPSSQPAAPLSSAVLQHLDESFPGLAERVRQVGFGRADEVLIRFSMALRGGPRHLKSLLDDPLLPTYTLRILELSPYLAEQLISTPTLIEDVYRVAGQPNARPAFEALAAPLNDVEGLKRFFRREMFRIQAASLCLPESVFQTLDRISGLAEFLIARVYRIAAERALKQFGIHAVPPNEMMVVALGRLGMREFDVCSDADLIFVIPDSELPRCEFWTRVAEQMVEILTAYTGRGSPLSVDTRLRPNGREGTLVQSESNYFDYFAQHAEAWEGIAYMKARGVAGDIDRSTSFLTSLQQVDWRRYGQSGRSREDLRHMRMRLQREQGQATPLKAGEGGYYDADFVLMYLRLRGAGLFFKSLNTPERIEILERMGHLDRPAAELLLDATTYFRAVDHALRLLHGRPESKLPSDPSELRITADMVRLWTRRTPSGETLSAELTGLQRSVRHLFDNVFRYR